VQRVFPLLASVLCVLAVSCKPDAHSAHAAPLNSGSAGPVVELAVLPNNAAVLNVGARLLALQGDNQVLWELNLPDDDAAIAPLAVALNSMTYVRGNKGLYAFAPDGKLAWKKPLDGGTRGARALDAPVALTDSTPAIMMGNDVVRFDHAGAIKWRVSLPEGQQVGRLSATMDGSVLIPSTAGIYSVTGDGNVAWRHPL